MACNDIKAVILAAGKGTRMKSSVPKVMHRIFGLTLLERVINTVFKLDNIKETFVIVGHQAETVTEFVKNVYSGKVSTVLQEPQLGTGDAVFKVYDNLKDYEGNVLILCGDTPLLTAKTLQDFIDFHDKFDNSLTVLSAIVDPPKNYGRIIRDEGGNLRKIVEEKDATQSEKEINEVNAGVYCLKWNEISPAFFEITTNNKQGEYYLTDIVDWAVKKGLKAGAFTLEDNREMIGINSRIDLAEASKIMRDNKNKSLMVEGVTIIDSENTWVSPETAIGQDSVIYPGCYIDGTNNFGTNNVIGSNTYIAGNVITENNVSIIQSKVSNATILENSSVGPFTHIRDNVKINKNVRIGNFVEVKKSEINNSTNIAHLSYIGDSTIGSNVNIGAGTITANYNAITKQKSRTEIEDGVKIGSNSVLVAPVKIAKNANVAAGSVVTKDVPENALAITRAPLKILENWVQTRIKQLIEK